MSAAGHYTLGAFAIVCDHHDRVLLSHRRDLDLWNLPGGRVQVDELPDVAAVREVREETGLEVEVVRLTGIYGRSDGQADIVFAFEGQVVSGSLVPTDEADRHEWFDVDQLPVNTIPETGSAYPRRVAAPARTDLPNADRTIRTSLARDPCRARRPAAA